MIQKFQYQGNAISFQFDGDTYINATEMAVPFGKKPIHFLKLKSTIAFIEALQSEVTNSHFTRKGNHSSGDQQGTWMHELLAIKFAEWLHPKFGVWCSKVIRDVMKTGSFSIQPTTPTEALLQSVQLLAEQERRLSKVEEEVIEVKALATTRPEWYSIAGYASIVGRKVSLPEASHLGRKAKKACVALGITPDSTHDPRFGKVGVYPKEVLKQLFA